jgi:peroxiredoxin
MKLIRPVIVLRHLAMAIICLAANLASAQSSEQSVIVPQNLLKLIHAPEVQRELGLEDDERLVAVLRDLDRVWWPSRILPQAKQLETIEALEAKLLDRLTPILSPDKLRRLREIETQSQGTRSLMRPEIAKAIGLNEQQTITIEKSFLATDSLAQKLNEKQGGDPDLETQLQGLLAEERRVVNDILTIANREALGKLIGQSFDTMALKRVYPLAPELVDSGEWATARRTSLQAERGKVVVVHFYAFQCHNCVANFAHYNRWHEALSTKGVTVIGIQTPETKAERDPALVKQAASKQGFGFPVLIDLKNANWDAWGNTMWPTVYVVDKSGYIRFWWQGELNWQGATGDKTIEKLVDELLAE